MDKVAIIETDLITCRYTDKPTWIQSRTITYPSWEQYVDLYLKGDIQTIESIKPMATSMYYEDKHKGTVEIKNLQFNERYLFCDIHRNIGYWEAAGSGEFIIKKIANLMDI